VVICEKMLVEVWLMYFSKKINKVAYNKKNLRIDKSALRRFSRKIGRTTERDSAYDLEIQNAFPAIVV